MATWQAISRGADMPGGAVLAGRTGTDGDVFVGKNKNGETGKLNTKDGKMYNIWCHDGGSSSEGEILIVDPRAPVSWVPVKRGQNLPGDAFKGGSTGSDGEIYVCRTRGGSVGKLNLKDGKVNNLWYQGDYFPKGDGEILCVGAVPAGAPPPGPIGGYVPAPAPAPTPTPAPPPAPAPVDPANFNAGADCDGIAAGERVKWLENEQGMPHDKAVEVVMQEFEDVFSDWWLPGADCAGVPAQQRAQWLVDNRGMTMDAARAQIKGEFPGAFGDWWKPDAMCDGVRAEERAQWLVDNKGISLDAAKQQIRVEFPSVFGHGDGGAVIDCKFPHTISVVQTPDGPKVKFMVTPPRNLGVVTMVAVHYTVNGGEWNVDINSPEAGTSTYVHETPGPGPTCPPGATVAYWLCCNVNGLLQEEPEGACPHPDRRLHWTAP